MERSQRDLFDDLESLSLSSKQVISLPTSPNYRLPRHRRGERFLKGPIPWDWLTGAGRLPGKALHVGLAIWHRAGLNCGATVSISLSGLMRELGVQRDAGRRGLQALEDAGLVKVERHAGRKPVVTILSPDRVLKEGKA